MTATAAVLLWYRVEFDLGHGWKIVSPQLQASSAGDAIEIATRWLLSSFPHYKGYGFHGRRAITTGT